MKRLLLGITLAVFLAASAGAEESSPAPTSSALTLADCYAKALKQSERIAIRKELIEEAQARFTQALSGILPQLTLSSSDKWQDEVPGSVFTRRKVPERKFNLSQPIFSGFKEFAAMEASKAKKRQRLHERARAEQLLLVDVSDAFHLILEKRMDLEALATSRGALQERIEELKGRQRLGRSRPSEVVSAQAQLHRIEAEMEQVRSDEVVARQLLEFLTGLERIGEMADLGGLAEPLDEERAYLAKALMRPDVKATEEAARVAGKEVKVASADFWPDVDLEGNYYLERGGATKEVDWDVALTVEVPIFQGGQVRGAVREAQSKERQAMLQLSQTRRLVLQEVRDAYTRVRAAGAQAQALSKALEATEESYWYQVQEYRLNLVSNLDVLQALKELQDARRELIQAQYKAKRACWVLKAAVGETLQVAG